MYAYPGFSYSDAYNLPVSIRKWFIKKFNKRQAEEQKNQKNQTNSNEPLNMAQKLKLQSQTKMYNNEPGKIASQFMGPVKK